MRITYVSTNAAHHYRYATELQRLGCLDYFLTGASRWSPRAPMPHLGDKLVRCDFFQNFFLLSLALKLPDPISNQLSRISNRHIDRAASLLAHYSDVFLYYRTTGHNTAKAIHSASRPILCVMEEVNTHVDLCYSLMKEEYEKLGLGTYSREFPDHSARLRAYEEADCILCPSSFVRNSFLDRGFAEERLLKVNFGFTIPSMVHSRRDTDEIFRILYVGQIHFRKGLRYAIEAFRRFKHPRKELLLVGPLTKVTGLNNTILPEGVRFTGSLKGEQLEYAYANASVFVLPTIEEGLALVQCEAMAAGLPLITTSHSGADDLITHGLEGLIVPPCDATALLNAFQLLADDPDLRGRMGQAALRTASKLGGWDVSAARLVNSLQQARDLRWSPADSLGED